MATEKHQAYKYSQELQPGQTVKIRMDQLPKLFDAKLATNFHGQQELQQSAVVNVDLAGANGEAMGKRAIWMNWPVDNNGVATKQSYGYQIYSQISQFPTGEWLTLSRPQQHAFVLIGPSGAAAEVRAPEEEKFSQDLDKADNEDKWKKINENKEESIAWMNAKNNATSIITAQVQSGKFPEGESFVTAINALAKEIYFLDKPSAPETTSPVATPSAIVREDSETINVEDIPF